MRSPPGDMARATTITATSKGTHNQVLNNFMDTLRDGEDRHICRCANADVSRGERL
jgi:hypothetical protein